ncbi:MULTISPECIES: cation:dicarboxylase symporter family transporter [unclassified Beijerinckia]|uniref:dicarboxylate/amino acid:cation symporter n=1 Tax=unclassified Beijerinckia TaxID=2638183 RepID=UPI00089B7092|nr:MULTISPECIES: cation:dicarboxylase symporter family transporter [unclassified Beijerinckia]MDH7794919.1 proton glutamate symport protein [Beijerinckia sp. GAS462]SEB80410.1 Na+/H+-dicarboxylate symporter [Beijerinckia sp. 28-YEA-48]
MPLISRFLRSPLAVVVAATAGIGVGLAAPQVALAMAPLSKLYIDLLKMVVLPFIVSSIIFSLRSLIRDPQASSYVAKVIAAVIGISAAAVVVGVVGTLVIQPGVIHDPATSAAFGNVINRDGGVATELQMTLREPENKVLEPGMVDMLLRFVPDNVFRALSEGDTIKVLVFALLFGFAVGRVPHTVSEPFAQALETVYRTCLILTHWFNLMLPLATFAMIAQQTASIGFQALGLMIGFLTVLGLSVLVFAVVTFMVIAVKVRQSPWRVLSAHRDVLVMAIATRSSVSCVPLLIETLVSKLGFGRAVVELLVPLQTALLRVGPVLMFAIAPIFIAQLYGRTLSASDIVLISLVALLLGPTTAGMSGITTIAQIGVICGYLGLPFDAAFVLFVAVDTMCDTLRTLAIVITVSGSTAAIAPRDQAAVVLDEEDEFAPAVERA